MNPSRFDFSGKVALITGAASGIGLATARKFVDCGAAVVLADLSEDAGLRAEQEIRSRGGQALFRRTDVTRMADCAALVEAALSTFGRLDAAFNNAGIFTRFSPTDRGDVAHWSSHLDVNLSGVFNCLSSELKAMKGGGAIVNNASIMGLAGAMGAAAYSAAKHGVIGLTRSSALEYSRHGVRINAVCPGFVATPMTSDGGLGSPKSVAAAVARTAMGRVGTPDEIAEAVLWLCSDAASFVTGTTLAVDGGFSAG